MKARFPKNPYCQRSWSSDPCPVAMLKEYGYPQLIQAVVLSDKTESIPSLNSLIEVRTMYESMHEPHSVSFKIDGWNIQASYYNGELVNVQTRGRSSDAMNAEAIAPRLPKTIPEMGRVLVVMECSIPDSEFMWFKENFGSTSQRGAVSTALANPEKCLSHVAIHAHGVRCSSAVNDKFALLKSWGFEVPMYAWVHNFQELMDQVKAFSDFKEAYGIPTDGLVVKGEATNALRIEAWEEPIYRSFVTGYDETYGPHAIAVQCKIYPIKLPNSVQRQLPATNLSRIINLNLRPGVSCSLPHCKLLYRGYRRGIHAPRAERVCRQGRYVSAYGSDERSDEVLEIWWTYITEGSVNMSKIYGIDLGTTNSLLGLGDRLLTGLVPSVVNLQTGEAGKDVLEDMSAARSSSVTSLCPRRASSPCLHLREC